MIITLDGLFDDLHSIAERLDLDLDLVQPSGSLFLEDDLGMDSLSMMDFLVYLEKKYQVSIPNEKLQQVATLGDVVLLLNQAGPVGAMAAATPVPAGAEA